MGQIRPPQACPEALLGTSADPQIPAQQVLTSSITHSVALAAGGNVTAPPPTSAMHTVAFFDDLIGVAIAQAPRSNATLVAISGLPPPPARLR